MRTYIFIILSFIFSLNHAQELLAEVTVDYTNVQGSSTTAYTALEKGLRDFINTTKWTDKTYKMHEKIECNFTIIIQERTSSNTYRASLLVQSRRPVFSSNYYSPVLNINDKNFDFEYTEYEQLIFNPRSFSGKNLTDVIGYYIYLVLGYDADTFSKEGGTSYFETAEAVAGNAQSSVYSGWSQIDGPRSRTSLISDILSPENKKLRAVYYTYFIRGLDTMMRNEVGAKTTIGGALQSLDFYQKSNNYAQNYPLDLFFQAKKNEIVKIFSGGVKTNVQTNKLKSLLNTISPSNSNEWNQIQ